MHRGRGVPRPMLLVLRHVVRPHLALAHHRLDGVVQPFWGNLFHPHAIWICVLPKHLSFTCLLRLYH